MEFPNGIVLKSGHSRIPERIRERDRVLLGRCS
jgi:hypothetical protein